LIVQQNYLSDLYPAKILNFSAKPFFLCKKILKITRIYIAKALYVFILYKNHIEQKNIQEIYFMCIL